MSSIIQSVFLQILHAHLLNRFFPLCTKQLREIIQNVADLLLLHKSQETVSTISGVGGVEISIIYPILVEYKVRVLALLKPGKPSINNHENSLPTHLPFTGGFAGFLLFGLYAFIVGADLCAA
jgi:hypothetical protein